MYKVNKGKDSIALNILESPNHIIFTKKEKVIFAHNMQMLLSNKDIDKYFKTGKTLNPSYYSANQEAIQQDGIIDAVNYHFENVIKEENKGKSAAKICGEEMFKLPDAQSGVFQIELTENIGLVSIVDAVNADFDHIYMRNNYYENLKYIDAIEITMLCNMAVKNASKCTLYLEKCEEKIVREFDNAKWNNIFPKIKELIKKYD